MGEVWLHSNRRVLSMAMAPVVALGLVSYLMLDDEAAGFLHWLGIAGIGVAVLLLLGLLRQFLQPRIAFNDGEVLFFLRARRPIAVPLRVVEAFFQGEGPAHLPGPPADETKSVNLIARLSRRETDWHERDVKPALGCWADGYVTVRGTWCEPITAQVIQRLNRRLSEVTKAASEPS